MKKIIMIVLALVVAGGAVWYFILNNKTDEELIKDQLEELADACSKRSGETSVIMAMNNSRISNVIASSCHVTIPQAMMNGSYTPMEFAGSMTRSRAMFNSLNGTIEEVEITLDNEKKKAVVDYAVRVTGTTKSGNTLDEARDLRSEFVKEDDVWKVSSFEIHEVLER